MSESSWLDDLPQRQAEMKARMLKLRQDDRQAALNRFADSGSDCRAALIILTSHMFNRDGRVWQHVDVDDHRISFDKILRNNTFSSGEYALLELAASLFNTKVKVNMWLTLGGLDDRCTTVALKAIHAYCRRPYAER